MNIENSFHAKDLKKDFGIIVKYCEPENIDELLAREFRTKILHNPRFHNTPPPPHLLANIRSYWEQNNY